MAYFELQTRAPCDTTTIDYEDQMPTHVLWGDIESGSHPTSCASSCSSGGRKKLKNKRLGSVPRDQESLAQHILFSSESASSVTTPGSREETLQIDAASKEVDSESIRGCSLSERSVSNARCERLEMDGPQQSQPTIPELSPERLELLRANVRKDENGLATSLGSLGHDQDCRPCLFVHTKIGCQSGLLCTFCHFWHTKKKRRPCKEKREWLAKRYENVVNSGEAAE